MRCPARQWILLITIGCLLACAYAGLLGLRVLYPIRFVGSLVELSDRQGLAPELVAAVIRAESRFKPEAVSPRGAIGLMQIMPSTGEWIADQLGVTGITTDDLYDPERNMTFGTWYLATLLDRFGNVPTALQAYNAGPTNAELWRSTGEAPFPETAAYVDRVLQAVPVYRFYLRFPVIVRITPSLAL